MSTGVSSLQRSRSLRLPASNTLKPPVVERAATTHALASRPLAHIKLFLTNLKLLDLDLQDDWPQISELTFSAKESQQNLKKRIQAVEWALYRLFELWDPEETLDKLRPFFPPIEPLQSLNLRAALYRCLDNVKKNGLLGRDAVLRKTMLDECKGERLEEVLAIFSTAVLNKVVGEDNMVEGALATQIAMQNFSYTGERTTLNTLILAHKISLRRTLTDKKDLDARYRDFDGLLKLRGRQITRRHEQLKVSIEENPEKAIMSKDETGQLEELIRSNWSGSNEWLEAILYGDTKPEKDGLIAHSYDDVWTHVEEGRIGEIEDSRQKGLLEQLDARLRDQNDRLAQWQKFGAFLKRDEIQTTGKPKPTSTNTTKNSMDLRFEDHINLQLVPGAVKEKPWTPLADYHRLMDNFQTELGNVGKPPARVNRLQEKYRQPIVDVAQSSLKSDIHNDSADGDGFESDSNSDADKQSPRSDHYVRKSPSQTPPSEHQGDEPEGSPTSRKTSKTHEAISGPADLPASRSTSTHSAMPPPSPPPALPLAEQILASMAAASPSPVKPRHVLSLAEKTRLSMSRTSSLNISKTRPYKNNLEDFDDDDNVPNLPKPYAPIKPSKASITARKSSIDQPLHPIIEKAVAPPDEDKATPPHPPPSLLPSALIERTRLSLSNASSVAKAAQLERRRSIKVAARNKRLSYLPARHTDDDLDPPPADADLSLVLEVDEKRRMIEKGAELELDYETVFMSRPRIKTSPERSPVREWERLGGGGEGNGDGRESE